PPGPPLAGPPERIQRGAAQDPQRGEQPERLQHPWPVLALDQLSLRIATGEQRRREMQREPVVALELRFQPFAKARTGVEPRDLVLVLVGHQLEERPRHRLREAQRTVTRERLLRGADLVDQ